MSNVDFDITNYNVEELINILGLDGEIPLNNQKISNRIDEMSKQFEDKYEENEYIIKVNKVLYDLFYDNDNVIELSNENYPDYYQELLDLKKIYFNPVPKDKIWEYMDKVEARFPCYEGNDCNYSTVYYNGIIMQELAELPPGAAQDGDKGYVIYFSEGPDGSRGQRYVAKNNVKPKSSILNDWNSWSSGDFIKEFKEVFKNHMSNNGFFNEDIREKLEGTVIDETNKDDITTPDYYYNKTLTNAYDAKEEFLLFFSDISNKLKDYSKEEYSQNYAQEEEENQKSLEGGIMDDSKLLLLNYQKPFYKTSDIKTYDMNIDSRFRTIADPIVCPRCPDVIEYYKNIVSNSDNVVLASNNDGKLLIVGFSGEKLYRLNDINNGASPDFIDVSLNKSVPETSINKDWVDITMSYNGLNVAACLKDSNIWVSLNEGNDNTWTKSIDTSGHEISGNWISITSDFTGKDNYITRRDLSNAIFDKKGIAYSNDFGTTWVDMTGTIKDTHSGTIYNLEQDWVDIVVSGDNKKIYAIYEKDEKYFIIYKLISAANWTILNIKKWDYSTNTELTNCHWKKIVTNFSGNRIFLIADNHENIWTSNDTGNTFSKIDNIAGTHPVWNSISCSLDGNKITAWDKQNGKMVFSENGGSTWKIAKYSTNKKPRNDSKIFLAGDGDYVLIVDNSGSVFTSKNCEKEDNKLFDKPSNFTINLTEPIKDVLSISFKNIELFHSWYVFSKNEGTNIFYIKKRKNSDFIKVEIPEGTYHNNDIHGADLNIFTILNEKCVEHDISFNYISYQNKVQIINKDVSNNVSIFWYYENGDEVICGKKGTGAKVNYNLGWLLGFRKTVNVVNKGGIITAPSQLDIKGTKYVYISLDEFTNSKQIDTCVTFENNSGTFNMPSYYVKTTMSREAMNGEIDENNKCYVEPDEVTRCGKKRANPDSIDNLTSAQRYTITNIRDALSSQKVQQYKSPQISNLLCKIPLSLSPVRPAFDRYTEYGRGVRIQNREYAGPITLRKFHIRLLNEHGNEIDMNEMDWSFSMKIQQLKGADDLMGDGWNK